MAGTYTHKRGDSFDILVTIPARFADGYFVGYAVSSQMRKAGAAGAKLADLNCTWQDAAATRALRLTCIDTSGWDVGLAQFDVQFKRVSDGFTVSTSTASVSVIADVTREA